MGAKDKLRRWLRTITGQIFDRHNCPVFYGNKPPLRPEYWDIWASTHKLLRAWRDLNITGRVGLSEPSDGRIRPGYDIVPCLRSDRPGLDFIQSSQLKPFRPRDGHRFLVCRLPDLKICCWAALCRKRWYAANGRLAGFFLNPKQETLEPFETWLEAVAGEFYVQFRGPVADIAPAQGTAVTSDEGDETDTVPSKPRVKKEPPWPPRRRCPSPGGEEDDGAVGEEVVGSDPREIEDTADSMDQAINTFYSLREFRSAEYHRWVRLTRALLETLPLGLPPGLLRNYLELEYRIDLEQDEIKRLTAVLLGLNNVANELAGFLADDTAEVVATRVGITFNEAIKALAPEGHAETLDARTRNAILKPREHGQISKVINDLSRENGIEPGQDAVSSLLLRHGLTLAGRLTDRSFSAQVRQQEYRLSVDDVIKAVAYELVADGLTLVAVSGSELVLEVPDQLARLDTTAAEVHFVVRLAQQPYLGALAARCECEPWEEW